MECYSSKIVLLYQVFDLIAVLQYQDVVDVSDGCGAKFDCIIVSPVFEGKAPLERHRMVNAALEEEMKSIHAFTMRTLTPAQWEKQQQPK